MKGILIGKSGSNITHTSNFEVCVCGKVHVTVTVQGESKNISKLDKCNCRQDFRSKAESDFEIPQLERTDIQAVKKFIAEQVIQAAQQ